LSNTSLARPSRKYTEAERGRMLRVLEEAEDRYRFELLERELLRDRIIGLKVRLTRASS
jgi:hypothetical protein